MNRKMLWVTALAGWMGGSAMAAELNTLTDLKVVSTATGAQVVVAGNKAPTFTVFRLNEPDRLVVDLSSADASAVKGHHEGKGPIAGVVASQFSDQHATVGRLMLALDKASHYDVKADGNRVVVSVDGAGAKAAADEPKPVEVAKIVPAPLTPTLSQGERGADVVASHVDEKPVKRPAKKLTALVYARDTLKIVTDGEVAKYELLELKNPPRLALDLYGLTTTTRTPKARGGLLADIRLGAHDGKVRLVLDMQGSMPAYEVKRTSRGLVLSLGFKDTAAPAVAKVDAPEAAEPVVEIDGKRVPVEIAEGAEPSPAPAPKKDEPPKAVAEVKDLTFEDAPTGGRVELKLTADAAWKVERPDARSAVLTLEGARIPKRLERSLDTSDLETPVKMVSAFSVPGSGDKVRVVVAGDGALEETVVKTPSGLSWRVKVAGVKTEAASVNAKTAGFSTEASRYAERGAPQQRGRYVGKRVSFEFKDIDIHNLLRIIAEVSKKNIVVADDVSGKVTIRLRNVPWDQALELILRSKGLGKEDLGNIIRVAPLKTLEEEAKLREERRKSQIRQADLSVQLIPVNYATADQMKERVKDVLSERGTVTVDTRTNVLIVRDIAEHIGKARSLVRTLDTQTPQVLIESRIVEANTNFTRQVGIQWGGSAQLAPGTGNPTGLIFPNTVAVRGGSSSAANVGTADTPNFAVNLPAAVGTGSGGALGFIFGSAGGAVALNLRLSALENQGAVKTISAPKVTTLDNSPARISQGVSIPFSQVSAQGVNTTFVEARLSLDVTPHITQDGSILMTIKAENNQPDPANTGANGQPAIQRKEANTQVLVKDGDTTVIGGIYVRRGSTATNRVPFLGSIPLLGFFFKNNVETDSRQELLIFITPRIINRQTIAQNL
ncbi:MAG: type IV pilus secretin PilQ [Myxococcota bacterium]